MRLWATVKFKILIPAISVVLEGGSHMMGVEPPNAIIFADEGRRKEE